MRCYPGPPPHFTPPLYSLSLHNLTRPRKSKSKSIAIELAGATRGVRRPPLTPAVGVELEGIPMSHPTDLPPPQMPPTPLFKQKSWSPDAYRDEAWIRRKGNHGRRNGRSKSVTDEDLDELKACIELGFGFNSPEVDQRLSNTLPALGLYYAVNRQYYDSVSKSASSSSLISSTASECDSPTSVGSPHTIFSPGDNPQTVKTRLKQWAQVVACSVRQSSSN